MRPRDVTPVWTYLLAAMGFLGALLSQEGSTPPVLWIAGIGLLGWSIIERVVAVRVPKTVARALDLLVANAILIIAATYFAYGRSSLRFLVQVLMVSQVARAVRKKTVKDLSVMHGTALAQVALAAFLTRSLAYLPILAVTILLGVAASLRLVGRHVDRTGDVRLFVVRPRGGARRRSITGRFALPVLLTVSILLAGFVVFVVLPRRYPFAPKEPSPRNAVIDPNDYSKDREESGNRVVGFSENVRLGELGQIKSTPWQAFFVRLQIRGRPSRLPPGRLYFRGTALDRFSGLGWARSLALRGEMRPVRAARTEMTSISVSPGAAMPGVPADLIRQVYEMEGTTSPILFGLDRMSGIEVGRSLPRVMRLGDGAYAAPRPHREGYRYAVVSRVARVPGRAPFDEELGVVDRVRCLQLPEGLTRVRALARRITAGSSDPLDRARAIEGWLRENCSYTLLFRERPVGNPVESFLFDTRAGHCEYFASAMAILLRAVDVPTRLIAGYRGGRWLEEQEGFLVWQKDAHAWLEAHLPDRGWVRFDPTPGDPEAVTVPAGRIPGMAPIEPEGEVGREILLAVREFGPAERDKILSGARRAVAFALREGLGFGRPDRPFPPPVPVLLGAALLWIGATRLLGWRARGGPRRGSRRRRGGSRARPEVSFYEVAVRSLAQRGMLRRASMSPREFYRATRTSLGEQSRDFRRITAVFERVRYGEDLLPADELERLTGLAHGLARRPQPDDEPTTGPSGGAGA